MTRKTASKKRHKNTAKGTTKSTVLNKRRKGALAKIVPWLKRFGIYFALLIFVIWIGAWIWLSNALPRTGIWINQQLVLRSAALGFTVENIMVEGRIYSDVQDVNTSLNVTQGMPLFEFDLEKASDNLKKLMWIKDVHIERRLPDTVYIHLKEHHPIALYKNNGSTRIISDDGHTIHPKDLSGFKDLPIIQGKGAINHIPRLINALKATNDIEKIVKGANRISERRWDIILNNETLVRLPEDNIELALKRLSDSYVQNDIMHDAIQVIDLRDPKRINIRPKPGMAKKLEEMQNSGSPSI